VEYSHQTSSIMCIGRVYFMLSNMAAVLDPLLQLSNTFHEIFILFVSTLILNNVEPIVKIPMKHEGHECWIID
jgi:hypothetical protein